MIATRTFEELIAKNQELARTFPKIRKGYVFCWSYGIPDEIMEKIVDKVEYIDNEFVVFSILEHRTMFSYGGSKTFSFHFFKDGIEIASYCPDIDMAHKGHPRYPEHDGLQFVNRYHPLTDSDLAKRSSATCKLERHAFRVLDNAQEVI
jgi:hypothetical protein